MTDKVKQMAPIIWEEIEKAKNVLLHFHPKPDPDSVGSSLAMKMVLEKLGKKATVFQGDNEVSQSLRFMPGFDTVVKKDYFEVDLGEFDLYIILDSGGIRQVSAKNKVIFPSSLRTVCIDHHKSNTENYAEINLVDSTYVSTCEMLFDLFSLWNIEINKKIAECLFVGIYTDSGGFKYPPANYLTFERAAKLAQIYPEFSKAIFEIENNVEPERIKFRSEALRNITPYFSNHVAFSVVDYDFVSRNGITHAHRSAERDYIGNAIKAVPGWNFCVFIAEMTKGWSTISMRGRGVYDLSKIASEIQGGGHADAAAGDIAMPAGEAVLEMQKIIQKVYPELGQP